MFTGLGLRGSELRDAGFLRVEALSRGLWIHVGGCQNYDPFWGTLLERDHGFDNHPCVFMLFG